MSVFGCLFVTPSLCIGGAERQLVQLLQNLDPQRYAMTVAVFIGADDVTQEGFYAEVAALTECTPDRAGRDGDVSTCLVRCDPWCS